MVSKKGNHYIYIGLLKVTVEKLHQINPSMRLMDNAPVLSITDNLQSFPQHYFVYNHDLLSLRSIIAHIDVDKDTLLFASEDKGGLYIQVGLIGVESYPLLRAELQSKIVYGRKWRIDKDVPIPEIIQTAYLAVQKAKEHEVRELLTYRPQNKKTFSALFSCHQDSELLKSVFEQHGHGGNDNLHVNECDIKEAITRLRFAGRPFILDEVSNLSKQRLLVDLSLDCSQVVNDPLPPEFTDASFELIVDNSKPTSLFYRLIDECITKSHRYVAEHFTYKGFARFSEALTPDFIASVSLASRPYSKQKEHVEFSRVFKKENACIDASRVPDIGTGDLYDINFQKLSCYPGLHGFLPNGLMCHSPTYAKK